MSTIDLGRARVTLVSALAWRVIAELARRNGDRYRLRLVQFHPGNSVHGVLRLELAGADGFVGWVEFSLGGPSGTYRTSRGDGRAQLGDLIMEHRAKVMDAVEADIGVPLFLRRLPASTGPVIALRLIAGLLERLVFEPTTWRASLAVRDWNGESHVAPWHAPILGAAVATDDVAILSRVEHERLSALVLIHPGEDPAYHPADSERNRALAADLSSGRIFSLHGDQTASLGLSDELYQAHGRDIRKLLALLETHLHG